LCQKLSTHRVISAVNKTIPISTRCYVIGQCHLTLTTIDQHVINFKRHNYSSQLFLSSKFKLLINHDRHNAQILFSLILKSGTVNTTYISTKDCYAEKELVKRNTQLQRRSGRYVFDYLT
jgi:hypothetical protein